jgi:murein L,D-transpeptidase YafK
MDLLDANESMEQSNELQDYSDFDTFCDNDTPHLYKDGLYTKILIMCNKPVSQQIDDDEFFDANMIKSRLKNHKTWHQSLEKSYRRFKVIEIMDECTVHQHMSFIWPYFEGKT